jgi:hypothetical protein
MGPIRGSINVWCYLYIGILELIRVVYEGTEAGFRTVFARNTNICCRLAKYNSRNASVRTIPTQYDETNAYWMKQNTRLLIVSMGVL